MTQPIPRTPAISVLVRWMCLQLNNTKGRKPIITTWAKHEQYDKVLMQMTSELKKVVKHMSFLIESSEHMFKMLSHCTSLLCLLPIVS